MKLVLAHGGDLSNPSGGTNRVSAFASGLQANGYDVTVVIPEPNEPLPERLANVSIETVAVETGSVINQPIRAGKITKRAKQTADEQNAVIQLEHSTLAGVGSVLGCEEYLLDMHDLAFPSPLYSEGLLSPVIQRGVKLIESRGVKNAEQIVVVSKNMQELVQAEWDLPDDRFTVIPNGYFPGTVEGYDTESTETVRVTFLGTLHPKIHTDTFLEIARLPLVEELTVIGDGAKYNELVTAKDEQNLESLQLYGRLPDSEAFPLVADSDVTINPQTQSRLQRASSPVKLYYYAALGTPMVVSSGPDLVETLADHDAAVAVSKGGDFISAVQEVLENTERQLTLAENAKQLSSNWTWSDRVNHLTDCYRRWGY